MSTPDPRRTAAYQAAVRSLYAGYTERVPSRDDIANAIAAAVEAALTTRGPVMFDEWPATRHHADTEERS